MAQFHIGDIVRIDGTKIKAPITHISHGSGEGDTIRYKVEGRYWNENSVSLIKAAPAKDSARTNTMWIPRIGEKVLYGNRPCIVVHVYDTTADLRTEDGYKLLGINITSMKPYKSQITANDSVRKAPARLHRALDAVLDARPARAKDSSSAFFKPGDKVYINRTGKEGVIVMVLAEPHGDNEYHVNVGGRMLTLPETALEEKSTRGAKVKDRIPQDCLDLGTLAL